MLMPKRTKHRKTFRLPYEGKAKGNTELHFGSYGLMAKEGAWITANQIEAARVAMTRYMKRGGKVWVNIFPNLSLTKKPLETRQGKGKGNPEVWVAVVKQGKIIYKKEYNNKNKERNFFILIIYYTSSNILTAFNIEKRILHQPVLRKIPHNIPITDAL